MDRGQSQGEGLKQEGPGVWHHPIDTNIKYPMSMVVIANHNSQITGLGRQPCPDREHQQELSIIEVKCDFVSVTFHPRLGGNRCHVLQDKRRQQTQTPNADTKRKTSRSLCNRHSYAKSQHNLTTPSHKNHLTKPPPKSFTMAEPGTTMTAPTLSLLEDDLATLLVGPDEQKFIIHESYIARNSDFFRAAMKKEWIEGQTRIVKLPEETDIECFVHYLNFAYHGKLPTESINTVAEEGFTDAPYDALGKIYVIGERMLDRSARNAIVREIMRLMTTKSPDGTRYYPASTCINAIYDGTSIGSPMRRMIVDMWVVHGSAEWTFKDLHPEFLQELAPKLLEKIIGQKTVRDFRYKELVAEDYFV